MDEKKRQEVALKRFALISPVLNCLFHTNGSGTRLRPVPVVHSNDTTRSREDTTCYCSLCFEKNSRMFMLPVSIQTAL